MKTRRNLISILLLCAAIMLPWAVQAQFTFTTNNGAITITGYTGNPTVLNIPSATNGYPVTSVATNAFYGRTSLTSVTIPSSVTNIGDYAFWVCQNLTSIIVAADNQSYSSVAGVLFNKSQTRLIAYPEGLSGSYTIPNSVTSIGALAFYICYPLNSVTIPSSVTNIGDKAFFDCGGLTFVTIPSSVTGIGFEAFFGCSRLISITVNTNNPAYSSVGGVLFNKDQTTLVEYPGGWGGSYNIPNSVTSIGDAAFNYCIYLMSVTVPNSVTNIGNFAFCQCQRLTSVIVPDSVVHIGSNAFASCTILSRAFFLGNAPSGDDTVFAGEFGTAYYLPGTTGWSSTFGGWPTAMWYQPKPTILVSGSGSAGTTNGFGFTIAWATNIPVVVEACTNLADAYWCPVATNTLISGTNYFSDPQWTNYPGRFYRLRSP